MTPKTIALACVLFMTSTTFAIAQQFVYPAKGQSPEQQKTDEAACYSWAVQQSGYDPARPPAAPTGTPQPTTATGSSPGAGVRGAARGALVGEVVGGDAGTGAAAGAPASTPGPLRNHHTAAPLPPAIKSPTRMKASTSLNFFTASLS